MLQLLTFSVLVHNFQLLIYVEREREGPSTPALLGNEFGILLSCHLPYFTSEKFTTKTLDLFHQERLIIMESRLIIYALCKRKHDLKRFFCCVESIRQQKKFVSTPQKDKLVSDVDNSQKHSKIVQDGPRQSITVKNIPN